ncbi:GDSL esterase/lipase LIP-4-like [Selaginella moellendorffii]|uniref:GDSL esterase/lipase LIP-4-like n=1 Tax=Selaginella moellendorffii TaxID=88036 RepID=UPI000D1C5B71|nr:GDSL esterase/lipase LIP-4-like [Selaginella moellendorffii]|eukprot:XP_024526024.1 GDSL esterase/lipase LIP-4-like [Selaginella moellendorffii]
MASLLALLSFFLIGSIVVQAAVYPYVIPNAVFGFTDSLSDTGNLKLALPGAVDADYPPYGMTIGEVTGRFSDGYLIIDFLNTRFTGVMEKPSLARDPSDTTYASLGFGSAGATVLPQPYPNMNPDILPAQVAQFLGYQQQVVSSNATAARLFSNALYYIEIGGNDINFALVPGNLSYESIVQNVIPRVVQSLKDSIANLHVNGSAVHFLIFNMPAAGCTPIYLARGKYSAKDELGCVIDANSLVQAFNEKIRETVDALRCEYPSANFMYFDFYEASVDFLRNSYELGFVNVDSACCGGGGDYNCKAGLVGCGCDRTVTPCSDPNKYMSWDGIHYTQHFYGVMADNILRRQYIDPPTPLLQNVPSTCSTY